MRQIYMDFNATTPVAPSAAAAMLPFLTEYYGNPSSGHAMGRICHEAIEDARGQVAALVGADRDEIVFTSGGTESNNLALRGILMRDFPSADGHLVISAIEHPAIARPAEYLTRLGYAVTVVGCDRNALVDPDDVRKAIRSDTRLVSIMHANNEVGTLQRVRDIASVCHERGVLMHTDAAQSVGKIRTQVDELDVDLLSLAGHKLYAPKGIGVLFVRQSVDIEPVMHGAGHEKGLRPGTENVPHIVGLGVAALLAAKELENGPAEDSGPDSGGAGSGESENQGERLAKLRDRLCDTLRQAIGKRLVVHGEQVARLPNTLSVNFPQVLGSELLARIPEICASTGAACHSNGTSISATLRAMGLGPAATRGTIRLSLGRPTTADDVDRAANLLIGAWESLV
ncbi:MAG: cysteine desulfurase family protein [Pirellulaceae bacterium]